MRKALKTESFHKHMVVTSSYAILKISVDDPSQETLNSLLGGNCKSFDLFKTYFKKLAVEVNLTSL